jgi:hypothetical protein
MSEEKAGKRNDSAVAPPSEPRVRCQRMARKARTQRRVPLVRADTNKFAGCG